MNQQDVEVTDVEDALDGTRGRPGRRGTREPAASDREFEGDVAADTRKAWLDIADLTATSTWTSRETARSSRGLRGRTLDELVGDDGAVLEALRSSTRLAVHRQTGTRARRETPSTSAATGPGAAPSSPTTGRTVAEDVARTGEPRTLAAMTPSSGRSCTTRWRRPRAQRIRQGEEPNRRVVVYPAG